MATMDDNVFGLTTPRQPASASNHPNTIIPNLRSNLNETSTEKSGRNLQDSVSSHNRTLSVPRKTSKAASRDSDFAQPTGNKSSASRRQAHSSHFVQENVPFITPAVTEDSLEDTTNNNNNNKKNRRRTLLWTPPPTIVSATEDSLEDSTINNNNNNTKKTNRRQTLLWTPPPTMVSATESREPINQHGQRVEKGRRTSVSRIVLCEHATTSSSLDKKRNANRTTAISASLSSINSCTENCEILATPLCDSQTRHSRDSQPEPSLVLSNEKIAQFQKQMALDENFLQKMNIEINELTRNTLETWKIFSKMLRNCWIPNYMRSMLGSGSNICCKRFARMTEDSSEISWPYIHNTTGSTQETHKMQDTVYKLLRVCTITLLSDRPC